MKIIILVFLVSDKMLPNFQIGIQYRLKLVNEQTLFINKLRRENAKSNSNWSRWFYRQVFCKKLLEEKIQVYAIVFLSNNILLDIRDERLFILSFDLNQILYHIPELSDDIDALYHFAWNGVRPELRDNIDVHIGNINMIINCIRLAIAKGIKRFIFPGSTNEYLYYGKTLNSNALPSPSDSYGATKVALRYFCDNYVAKNGVDFIYTLIAGIYAADRRNNNVIFYTIDKLLHKEKPSLTELEQLWDYVYIDDVIDALYFVEKYGKTMLFML